MLSRGNEGRSIFLDDEDRSLFLEALYQLSNRFKIDICAYVPFFGSKDFIDRIRSAYPGKMANKEVAEKVRAGGENDPKVLLKKGAEILNCDIDELRFSRRISQKEKEGRDLLRGA